MAHRSRSHRSLLWTLVLAAAACADSPASGVVDTTDSGDDAPATGESDTGADPDAGESSTGPGPGSSEDDSGSSSGDTVAVEPEAGYYRWTFDPEIQDDCYVWPPSTESFVTRVSAVMADGLTMAYFGYDEQQCELVASQFDCEDLVSDYFWIEQGEGLLRMAGEFDTETSGTIDFAFHGECEGPQCEGVGPIGPNVVEWPCDSIASAQGTRMVEASLADEGCTQEGTIHSDVSSNHAIVEIANASDADYRIYWLNVLGERVLHDTLAPGESATALTYLTHPWLIADDTDACLSIHLPTAELGRVVLR